MKSLSCPHGYQWGDGSSHCGGSVRDRASDGCLYNVDGQVQIVRAKASAIYELQVDLAQAIADRDTDLARTLFTQISRIDMLTIYEAMELAASRRDARRRQW